MPISDYNLLRQIRALTQACLFDGVQVVGVCYRCIFNLPLYLGVYLLSLAIDIVFNEYIANELYIYSPSHMWSRRGYPWTS